MLNYHKFLMKQYEVGSFPIVGKNCWSLPSYFYHFSLWLWWAKILYKGTAIAISTTLQMTLRWLTSCKGYGYDYQRLTYQSQSSTFTIASHLVLSLSFLLSLLLLLLLSLYLQLTEKKKILFWNIAWSSHYIYCSANWNQLICINPFEQVLALSLILPYSQNWLLPNKPQKHVKHETYRTLTQKQVKKKYRKKMQSKFLRFKKTV